MADTATPHTLVPIIKTTLYINVDENVLINKTDGAIMLFEVVCTDESGKETVSLFDTELEMNEYMDREGYRCEVIVHHGLDEDHIAFLKGIPTYPKEP